MFISNSSEAIFVATTIERSFFHQIDEGEFSDRLHRPLKSSLFSVSFFVRVEKRRYEFELGVSPPIESGGEID